MDSKDFQKRLEGAHKLLSQKTTNREKFEEVRSLIKGINPKVDLALERASAALSGVEKLEKGEIIELTLEHLQGGTEEEKRRKKRLLFLIKQWKELENEVNRVRSEFENMSQDTSSQGKTEGVSRIILKAKGPLGIITIAAVVLVAIFGISNLQKAPTQQGTTTVSETPNRQKIKVIIVDGKKIPLEEIHSATGPECDREPHYHAKANGAAKALDGSKVIDPGGCGFGKASEVSIQEVESN